MAYTNSSLVSYTKLSPHHSGTRNHAIDTISIHCMAGNLSVETCGQVFINREASSNYGIGSDGRIALYVEEKNRSWCTSSASNDNRAVTIEVANNGGEPDWPVSDAAMKSLIKLVADICKRNNIKELKWQGNKALIGQVDKQNMTVHRWFASKACPGNYLYNKHGYIAQEVNKILNPPLPDKITGYLDSATLKNNKFTAEGWASKGSVGNQTVTVGIYSGSKCVKSWKVKANGSRPDVKAANMGAENSGYSVSDDIELDPATYKVKAFVGSTQLANIKSITVPAEVHTATGKAKNQDKNYSSGKNYKVNAKDGLTLRNAGSSSAKVLCNLPYGTKVSWNGYYTGTYKLIRVLDGKYKGSTGFCLEKWLV